MSCSEMGNTKFIKCDTEFKVNGEKGMTFSKTNNKQIKKAEKNNSPKQVYQIKTGARIIKLTTVESYKSFRAECQAQLGKSSKNLDIEKYPLSTVLKSFDGAIDGIIVGKELAGQIKDPLLAEAGVKIFNENAIVKDGESYEPLRTGFKSMGTEISPDVRSLSAKVFENSEKINEMAAKHTTEENHQILFDGKSFTISDEKIQAEFNKGIEDLNGIIKSDVKVDMLGKSSSQNKEGIIISAQECMSLTKICKDLEKEGEKNSITMDDSIMAMGLYLQSSKDVVNVKANKAYKELENSVTLDDSGEIVKFKGEFKEIKKYSSEILHREKQIWSKALATAPDDKKEQIEKVAQIKLNEAMKRHEDLVKKHEDLESKVETNSVDCGDIKIRKNNFMDPIFRGDGIRSITQSITKFTDKIFGFIARS